MPRQSGGFRWENIIPLRRYSKGLHRSVWLEAQNLTCHRCVACNSQNRKERCATKPKLQYALALTPELEHFRMSVHQTSFHPIYVFLSSSPDTQRSQRPGNTLKMGCWLEFKDTSKPWTEAQSTAGREEEMFKCNTQSPLSSHHRVWLSVSRQETWTIWLQCPFSIWLQLFCLRDKEILKIATRVSIGLHHLPDALHMRLTSPLVSLQHSCRVSFIYLILQMKTWASKE